MSHLETIIIKGTDICRKFVHPHIPALPVPAPISVLVLDLKSHCWNATPRNKFPKYLEWHPRWQIDYSMLLNEPVERLKGTFDCASSRLLAEMIGFQVSFFRALEIDQAVPIPGKRNSELSRIDLNFDHIELCLVHIELTRRLRNTLQISPDCHAANGEEGERFPQASLF